MAPSADPNVQLVVVQEGGVYMAQTTARRVADVILTLSNEQITNLKLQKLLYYAQAWYLALYGCKLFDDDIEAWVHGPVVARVFGDFKGYRWNPIDVPIIEASPQNVSDHVREVLESYGGLGASALERLTHTELPWREARGTLPPDEPSRNVIKPETMMMFYSTMMNA
jgi:uncharacterized phage-associated protein